MVQVESGCDPRQYDKDWSTCGGSLISPTLVLSAWHCTQCPITDNFPSFAVIGAHRVTRYTVKSEMSSYFTRVLNQDSQVLRIVKKSQPPTPKHNDLGLFHLEKRVTLGPHVAPILVPEKKETYPQGFEGTIAGWGQMNLNDNATLLDHPTYLQKCVVHISRVDATVDETNDVDNFIPGEKRSVNP